MSEELLEMQSLANINHVDEVLGLERLHPVVDGGKVGCRVERGPIRLQEQKGRDLLRV